MRPKITSLILAAGMVISFSSAFSAADRATTAEAKTMLQKAVAHYESAGRKQALADFSAKNPPFVDRELYVVCIGPDHLISANGNFPQYVGTSADALRDATHKPLGGAILDAASSKGDGSVRYMLINPTTGKLEPKITFVQKVGDDVCGVGVYNPQ